jgi:ABC-type multidrug transport system ATPase subunit
MAELGLQGTEHVLIGSPQKKGISGGQRKRVNLAMELLTDPSVLFLDEPTSGLSSEDALMVMKLLRKLADDGKTILLTIHQPSLEAYRVLDNLILVGKDQGSSDPGRLTYYGLAYPQAVEFFNPDGVPDTKPGVEPSPDEVLRGFSRKETDEWTGLYDASPLKRQYVTDRVGKQPVAEEAKDVQSVGRDFGFTQWWTLVPFPRRFFYWPWPRSGSAARIRLARSPASGPSIIASAW